MRLYADLKSKLLKYAVTMIKKHPYLFSEKLEDIQRLFLWHSAVYHYIQKICSISAAPNVLKFHAPWCL